MELKIIYEDKDTLVVDKPAGVPVFKEGNITGETLADYLIEKYPELKKNRSPRHGIVHRLDKDTSGILVVAKNPESLIFLQNQFINRKVEKKYTALVVGDIKQDSGVIETLLGRSPKGRKKQKVYLPGEPDDENKRQATSEYKVLERYGDYTLLEVIPKTGRKHQIRCHLTHIHHPIVGDKLYGFKGQSCPEGLTRHFLHASYLKIQVPSGEIKEFKSELPEELKVIIKKLCLQK